MCTRGLQGESLGVLWVGDTVANDGVHVDPVTGTDVTTDTGNEVELHGDSLPAISFLA